MANGLPVVAPAAGGVLGSVVPGHTGLLFPAGDAERFAVELQRLIFDEEWRRSLGARARRHAEVGSGPIVMDGGIGCYTHITEAPPHRVA